MEWVAVLRPESRWGWGAVAISVLVPGLMALRSWMKKRRKRKQREAWNKLDKDVVLLHQFQRGKCCPNLGPFAIKVETFLRLAGIKYEVDTSSPFSSKGKCPWVTVGGEDIADSEFIIEALVERRGVTLDNHLEPGRAAALQAAKVVAEEHVFWCVITWRYWHDRCETFLKSQSFSPLLHKMFPMFMARGIKKRSMEQGIGKHTQTEVYGICRKACGTLAALLGDGPFYGGENPCVADCAIFGQLAQLRWNAPGSHYEALVTEVHPILAQYCARMKERVYPDWDNLLKLN